MSPHHTIGLSCRCGGWLMPQRMAFLFPGQGSQNSRWYGTRPLLSGSRLHVNAFTKRAILVLDLVNLCFNGPAEELQSTANAQRAILVHSVIACGCCVPCGIAPMALAGHSLGETGSGGLWFYAVCSCRPRCTSAWPLHAGSRACGRWGDGRYPWLWTARKWSLRVWRSSTKAWARAANHNCPGQIVISGHAGAGAGAMARCLEQGAVKSSNCW